MNNEYVKLVKRILLEDSNEVLVYHGTATGKNNENIESFKKGIDPKRAKGFGQGEGFYVYASERLAKHHAIGLYQDKIPSKEEAVEGMPLLIELKVNINPEEWDLDYEVSQHLAKTFIYDNLDYIKKTIPDDALQVDEEPVVISSLRQTNPSGNGIQGKGIQLQIGRSKKGLSLASSGTTGSGEWISTIMNYLQKNDPQNFHKYEQMSLEKVVKEGNALKYVGTKILYPSNMYVFKDDKWVSIS